MVNRTFRSLGADDTAWPHQKNGGQIFTNFFVKHIHIVQVDLNTPTKQAF